MSKLELKGVVHRYGRQTTVNGVDFRLAQGRIACLLGPSGCGKTTLLRCIAGFEALVAGEVRINGGVVSAPGRPSIKSLRLSIASATIQSPDL